MCSPISLMDCWDISSSSCSCCLWAASARPFRLCREIFAACMFEPEVAVMPCLEEGVAEYSLSTMISF